MGACCSNGFKAGSPIHEGANSTKVSRDGFQSVPIPSTTRSEGEILRAVNLKSFTLSELEAATGNFRIDSLLGEGCFGSVFKGWVDEHSLTATKPGTGLVIAVKRLNKYGSQGHKEWLAEINYLGQLHHPNLVKLIGYCIEDDHRLLVYEFMPQGSVELHLLRRRSHLKPLPWSIRMKVALGAAKGLAFLHIAERQVIYRDFKTSDILLDSNYCAKLSDFGLAREGPTGDKTHVSTRVLGTHGYGAPEYITSGHLTTKCDVYSFGVVLLELLSGRRVVDKNRSTREQNLVASAGPYLTNKNKILRLLDARLEGRYSVSQALKVAKLAHLCLSRDSKLRPRMDEVVTALEQIHDSEDTVKDAHKERRSRQF